MIDRIRDRDFRSYSARRARLAIRLAVAMARASDG